MPIPFIIAGLAVVAGGYGVKKGCDAKCDFDDAETYNKWAKEEFEGEQKILNTLRKRTNESMERLGKFKIEIYQDTLADFIEVFSEIKNLDFEDNLDLGLSIEDIEYQNVLEIKEDVLKITELAGGTVAALSGGALAGFGAFGTAGMLATASTGTAISSLTGVAATNATLAWFGGGSLAAGGLGMAGGTAILGGIVAGPILAVGGAIMAAKAETARNEAISNLTKARVLVEEIKTAEVIVREIKERLLEFINILKPLQKELENYIDKLELIIDRNNNYATYSENEKQNVMICVSIAQTIKNICDVPIIDEEGEITKKSKRVLRRAKDFVSKLEEI